MDGLSGITPEQWQLALQSASPTQKVHIERLLNELKKRKHREAAQEDFLCFVRAQWPDFISGAHHKRIADVMARLDPRNLASARLCERLGMRHEAHTREDYADRDGTWSDTAVYGLLRREWASA